MSLVLALETSSAAYGVAVGTPQELITEVTVRRESASFPGFGRLVSSVLESVGVTFPEITQIAVDVGPGSLSSVRTGIAYANGLAFSLGRQVFCASSLELLALEVAGPETGAVLCLRNAGGGNVYAGLFRDGVTLGLRHGPMAEVVPALCGSLAEVSVAGAFRQEAARALTGAAVRDTGVEVPDVRTLAALLATRPDWKTELVPVASPLTETSEVFQEAGLGRTAPGGVPRTGGE